MVEDQTYKSFSFVEPGLDERDFSYCNFHQCDFSGVNLHEVKFEECQFIDCNFSGAIIAETAFKDAVFKGCKLTGLDFQHASPFLLHFTFDHCQMELANFYGLDLKGTLFTRCQLRQADFTNANLEAAQFMDCDLEGAIFEQCNLQRADFRTAWRFNIRPEHNQMQRAKFNADNLQGLLGHLNLAIEDPSDH